jgi:membrane-associated phospholipid phosphatase
MMWQSTQRDWFLAVNRFAEATPALHAPMRIYAEYGVVLFAAVLLLAWWRARGDHDPRTMAAALWAPAGTLLAVGLNQPLVNGFREARPYTVLPHALVLVSRSRDYSFPSDHAVMAGAVAVGVLLTHRRLGVVTAIAALVMAFARVYAGAHFPLDVVVGLLFGAAVALLGWFASRALLVAVVTGLTRTPLRPLLTTSGPGVAR